MQLSPEQKTTFKNWLTANADGLDEQAAANLANALVSPSYLVWRSVVNLVDVQTQTGFDWTRVDNLSVGKARIWDWMFNSIDAMQPWRGNYREGINAVWVGTAADLAVRAAVNAACQRPVTNFEKLYVVQTTTGPVQSGNRGTTTNADTLGIGDDSIFIEGDVSAQFVSDIRNS